MLPWQTGPHLAAGAAEERELRRPVQPGHVVVPENTKGGATVACLRNISREQARSHQRPYVRLFFQARNVMELLQMIHDLVPEGDEVAVHLVTQSDRETASKQAENLNQMVSSFTGSRVAFSWKVDPSPNFHARSITTTPAGKSLLTAALISSKSSRPAHFLWSKPFRKRA